MTTDYGTDVSTFPVLDLTGRTIANERAIAECIGRALCTPEGKYDYLDSEDTYDLRQVVNTGLDADELYIIEGKIERVAERDERVYSARAVCTIESDDELRCSLTIRPVEGRPFDLVFQADRDKVALLR